MSRMSDADQIARRQREEAMTTSEHTELLERIAVMREKNQRRGLGITEAEEMLSEIAALASTPSPAQQAAADRITEIGVELGLIAPSPVQGADDRLAQAALEAIEMAYENMHLSLSEFRKVVADALATYQQSPQAALNEVRAEALEDAADAWHAEHSGTRPGPYGWLRARAAELRATPQTGDVE